MTGAPFRQVQRFPDSRRSGLEPAVAHQGLGQNADVIGQAGHVANRPAFGHGTIEGGNALGARIGMATGQRALAEGGDRPPGDDAVPLDQIFDREGAPRLILITCGGQFNSEQLNYSDNVVVVAVPQ